MNGKELNVCKLICWGLAVLVGFIVFLSVRAPTSLIAALLLGVALAVFLGLVLTSLFCGKSGQSAGHAAAVTGADASTAGSTLDSASSSTEADAAAAQAEADKKAEVDAAATKAEAAKKAEVNAIPDYDKDGVLEGENEGTRPAGLSAARDGKADDLKQIKGVGPKMEQTCNGLGFYHFDQIAAWTADEIAWVDANLKGFRGRVSRDNWVAQAKILAVGGETEFSKRVEDGDVY